LLWVSNGPGKHGESFAPTVVPSLSGNHSYGDMTARMLGVLQYLAEAPGLLEKYGWVARAWDDSWVSGGSLVAEARKLDPSVPLAAGLLGTFKGPELPFVFWGGGVMLLSRAALLKLRGGGAEWCWGEVQRVTGKRGAELPAEDVWVTKCLQLAGVSFHFLDGLFQGSPHTNGVLPHHPQWLACGLRLVLSPTDSTQLVLEGESGNQGMAGVAPISFHYMTPHTLEETYRAYHETPCPRGQHQRELDAAGEWRALPLPSTAAAPRALHTSAPLPSPVLDGGCAPPTSPVGGSDLAIVIAARSNAVHRHTAVYLSLGLTLKTVAASYPRALVVVVDNAGGSDPSLAAFLAERAPLLLPALPVLLLNNSASESSGFEWGGYAYAARALGWGERCLPFSRVLFLQHTNALVAPLPPHAMAPIAPCFLPVYHFPDLYDSQEQVDWVRQQLAALGVGPTKGEDQPLCGGASGTNFLIGAPCLRAWLAAGAFDTVRVRSKEESMGMERLVPQLSRALCAGCMHCTREESLDGFHSLVCEDSVEDFVLGRNPARYAGRAFVKTVASGMCGGFKGKDLRGPGGAWEALDRTAVKEK
jgi:hypothetical protein